MPAPARSGRARISLRHPSGLAVCDVCGFWVNHHDLTLQFGYAGNKLVSTGRRVCDRCLDIPQDQYRAPILPADPYPLINPRPASDVTPIRYIGQPAPTTPANQGFSQYVLGASVVGQYPVTTSAVLAAVAAQSGIATPGGIIDRGITLASQNAAVSLMAANGTRSYLLLYNPATPQFQVSKTSAIWGNSANFILGPGQAYFWATSQGLGTVYQGALSVIGLTPGVPIFAWEA